MNDKKVTIMNDTKVTKVIIMNDQKVTIMNDTKATI